MSQPFAALALAAISTCPLAAQESARWYDLRPTLAAGRVHEAAAVDLRLPVSGSEIDAIYFESEPDSFYAEQALASTDDCVRLVRAAIGAEGGATSARVSAVGGRIQVLGDEAAQAAASRIVEALRAASEPRVYVEVMLVPTDALAERPGAVLDAEAAAALHDAHPEARRWRDSVSFGRFARLGRETKSTAVRDYDVEVAQGAIAADPTVSWTTSGVALGLRVDAAAEPGRIVVRAFGRSCRPRTPARSLALPQFGGSEIDLPDIDTSIFASSGVVPSGGALVVDTGSGETLVVRALDRRLPAGAEDPTLRFGALGAPAVTFSPRRLSIVEPSRGLDPRDEDLDPRYAAVAASQGVPRDPQSLLGGLLQRRDLVGSALVMHSLAVGPWSAEDRDAAQERLIEANRGISTHRFEFALELLPAAAAAEAVASAESLNAFAENAGARMTGAVLDGDTMILLAGTESAYLQDHDTQIAAGAAIGDPIVKATFDGVQIWCAPLGFDGEAATAWFDVTVQEGRRAGSTREAMGYLPRAGDGDEGEARATGSFEVPMPIELGATRVNAARTLARMKPGRWRALMAQPVEGTDSTLVLAVRCDVTER